MNLNKMMKECTKPHAMVHIVTGAGLALLVASLLSLSGNSAFWLGLILIAVAFVGEMQVQSKGRGR